MSLTPPLFTSGRTDGSNPALLQPSHWDRVAALLESHFQGTDDDYALLVNAVQAVRIPTSLTGTMVVGNGGSSLSHTTSTTGFHNTLVGRGAGEDLTTAGLTTAVGSGALANNTNSGENTAVGAHAATALAFGGDNVAIGVEALWTTATANNTIAVGVDTLALASTANNNVAVGHNAGHGADIFIAEDNVLVGCRVAANVTGAIADNVIIGADAAVDLLAGSRNIIIGADTSSYTAFDQDGVVSDLLNIGGRIFGDLSNGRIAIGTFDAFFPTFLSHFSVQGNASFGSAYFAAQAAPANGVIVEGRVGIGTPSPTSPLQVVGFTHYADNAAAVSGGLTAGALYHTSGTVKVVT